MSFTNLTGGLSVIPGFQDISPEDAAEMQTPAIRRGIAQGLAGISGFVGFSLASVYFLFNPDVLAIVGATTAGAASGYWWGYRYSLNAYYVPQITVPVLGGSILLGSIVGSVVQSQLGA